MPTNRRPVDFLDELLIHAKLWKVSPDYERLPLAIRTAVDTLHNELLAIEALRANGAPIDDTSNSQQKDAKAFLAIFQKRFETFAAMEFRNTMSSALWRISAFCKKLREVYSSPADYLQWFFEDFLGDEGNLRIYGNPPRLEQAIGDTVFDKFRFANRDRLRARCENTKKLELRNALVRLATDYVTESGDASFGESARRFAEAKAEIPIRRFAENFRKILERDGGDVAREILSKLRALATDALNAK